MRLHRLEMSAFGPYAGIECIDFDALAEHGLFLLNGPTGSGKTSILDAVCFALYGSLPGTRLGTKSLKSDHALAEAEPWVLLEFTAQGRRFEVRRSPEWPKPSARAASGWVNQKAATHVRELVEGEWKPLTSRNDEAGELLGTVLGMGREQFTRVVLLPQGEFAAFLRAKAVERVDLLEKLFGTQRFADVEAQLGLLAQAARADADAVERGAAGHLVRLQAEVEALGPEVGLDLDPEAPLDAGLAVAVFDAADGAFAHRHERATAQRDEALAALNESRAAAETLTRSLDDAAELQRARERRTTWEAGAAEHSRREARLAAHAAATGLRTHLADADRTAHAAAQAEGRARTALEAAAATGWVPGAEPPTPSASVTGGAAESMPRPGSDNRPDVSSDVAADSGARRTFPEVMLVRTAASEASAEAAVLAERLSLEQELADLEAQSSAAHAAQTASAMRAKTAAETVVSLDEESAALDSERRALEPVAATLAVMRLEAAAAEAVVTAVEDHAEAARALAAAQALHGTRREAALTAKQRWLELRERRLEQAAAELAAHLDDAEPCPVCGSHDHPAPARGAEDPLMVVDAERAAAAQSEAAADAEREARDQVEAAKSGVAAVDARGGATDPDKAVRDLEEKLAAVQRAADADARLTVAVHRAGSLAQRRAGAVAQCDEASAGLIRAEEQATRIAADLAGRRADVAVLRAGFVTIEARRADAAARARALGSLTEALGVLLAAEAERDRAQQALNAVLGASDFADAGAVRAALLDETAAQRDEAVAAAYLAEGQQLDGLFASAAVRRATEAHTRGESVTAADLAEIRDRESVAERLLRDAELTAQSASGARARCRALREKFEAAVPALEEARARAHTLGELARTARGHGENSRKMSLHTYVLAARLEQVAAAATERLLAMSDGRFSLEHSDALAARGAASGLGLEVVDGWTGQRRDPSTLSGGESFMASLALALALADVVQHESGGIDIETLFVDEGFGSLDEQTLEQVMDSIEGLRAGGRVVGLVSHVAELKQRIPAQIRVSKGRNGSHIESVGLTPR